MKYQDTRINGETVESGNRICAERYEIIKKFCDWNFQKGFSVLDIGANMCYFGLRLIEDFDCSVMAFEFHQFEQRNEIIKQNKTKNLLFLKRKITIEDLRALKIFCHFDLVLGLSVLHHLAGKTDDWIEEFRSIGDEVIIEFAMDDSKRTLTKKDYIIPANATELGRAESHLDKSVQRPILHIKGK